MTEQSYWRDILAINAANLAANLEVLSINHDIQAHGEKTDAIVIALLTRILEVLNREKPNGKE